MTFVVAIVGWGWPHLQAGLHGSLVVAHKQQALNVNLSLPRGAVNDSSLCGRLWANWGCGSNEERLSSEWHERQAEQQKGARHTSKQTNTSSSGSRSSSSRVSWRP
jgi:hypothetical protein